MKKKNGEGGGEAELVGMEEAIGLLKTTRQTFYRWLRSGKLKGMKVGRQWRFYREDIDRFLKGEEPRVAVPGTLKPLLAALTEKLAETGKVLKGPLEGPDDLQAVSLMVLLAVRLRASDLHLEPMPLAEGGCSVALRYRIDGVLHKAAEFEAPLLRPILERWKIMGNVNLHEPRKPQDCRIRMSVEGTPVDIRVAFVPAALGESITARFLDTKGVLLTLDRLEYPPRVRQAADRFLSLPWGLMIMTGPVGSGKTTVLYACLNQCVRPERKVMTVEDPVEYLLPGVTQIPVRVADGVTFPAAIRSILRSDPDVVMVGEIRDLETLRMAQQMALTGHLVLTTMHTQNAAQALKRMADVGSDPFTTAWATKLVLAQRLARRLCPSCARKDDPPPDLLAWAEKLARLGGLAWEGVAKNFRKAVGCPECRQTGFRGRIPIVEALEVTPEMQAAIRAQAAPEELEAVAVRQGMTTVLADGLRRAAAGDTTLEEVGRLLPG